MFNTYKYITITLLTKITCLHNLYTAENFNGLHDFQVDILKIVYHHLRRFITSYGFSKLEDEFQGLGLGYLSHNICCLKDKQTCWVTALFTLSTASHCQILAQQIRQMDLHKIHFFLSVLVFMT